jgi:hypothetical protein
MKIHPSSWQFSSPIKMERVSRTWFWWCTEVVVAVSDWKDGSHGPGGFGRAELGKNLPFFESCSYGPLAVLSTYLLRTPFIQCTRIIPFITCHLRYWISLLFIGIWDNLSRFDSHFRKSSNIVVYLSAETQGFKTLAPIYEEGTRIHMMEQTAKQWLSSKWTILANGCT